MGLEDTYHQDAKAFYQRFAPFLRRRSCTMSNGIVAVHGGHFLLLQDGSGCCPSVETTSDAKPEWLGEVAHRALNRFSLFTWHLACAALAEVKTRGQAGGLITVVNDWQYLRRRTAPAAVSIRDEFYRRHKDPFPLFLHIMGHYGLSGNDCLPVAGWRPFLSESWLRRRIEKRLKKMVKTGQVVQGLTTESAGDGPAQIVFDDFGRACRLLLCGQACAAEVMELVFLLHEMGCRQLINFIPAECEIPVNEGTCRAIALFKLTEFAAVNVALPCIGAVGGGGPTEGMTVSFVSGQKVGGDRVEATKELHRCLD